MSRETQVYKTCVLCNVKLECTEIKFHVNINVELESREIEFYVNINVELDFIEIEFCTIILKSDEDNFQPTLKRGD